MKVFQIATGIITTLASLIVIFYAGQALFASSQTAPKKNGGE